MSSMSFDEALAAVGEMTERARQRRIWHYEHGDDDEAFVDGLIFEFRTEAIKRPVGAGAVHMALSLYRMVELEDRIAELTDALAMRDDALDIAWRTIDGYEGHGAEHAG